MKNTQVNRCLETRSVKLWSDSIQTPSMEDNQFLWEYLHNHRRAGLKEKPQLRLIPCCSFYANISKQEAIQNG